MIHAASIPPGAQDLTTGGRKQRGVEMLNACNGRKWEPVPEGLPVSEVERCMACAYLVEYTKSQNEA